MLWQLHWQYTDGTTEIKAQRDVMSTDELRDFVAETKESHPLPKNILWMACNETSKHFVLMAK